MSKEQRLYNFEINPPTAVWEKIAAELDASELSSKFPARLKQIEIPPPAEAWHKIAAMLDASSLVNDYAKRLDVIEVMPPASAWEKIQLALDEESVQPFKEQKKIIPWLRYAAAAAIAGLLFWGGSRLLNKNSSEPEIARQITTPIINNPVAPQINPAGTDSTGEDLAKKLEEDANDIAVLEASKKTYARLEVSPRSKIRNAANFFFAAEEDGLESRGITRGIDIESDDMHTFNMANRYVTLMTPEGNLIRMSKKLGDLVCCVSGELEEKDCIDQMKKWREKIAYTPSGHSPGNFMEVLNLVNSLQEH